MRAVRAAGAGSSAAAADGGAIAAAVAATGRGAAVGDRGRGCRRRNGWVRPGLGRAGPPLLGGRPGLCVGLSGREQWRRLRPSRGDASVWSGERVGRSTATGFGTGPTPLPHLLARTKARRCEETPRAPLSRPGCWWSASHGQLQSCQRLP